MSRHQWRDQLDNGWATPPRELDAVLWLTGAALFIGGIALAVVAWRGWPS